MVTLKLICIISTTIKDLFLEDADIESKLVGLSSKISSGAKSSKYFIDNLHDNYEIKPLHIMLPKIIMYAKSYDGQTNWIYFYIADDDLLEKYSIIWDKVSADIKKEFDSKPGYNKKILKPKIKSCGDEATDFPDKEIPKLDSNHTCLTVISLNSAFNKSGKNYQQVFLKGCKYIKKGKKILDILTINCGIFLILMGLMKNKLDWVRIM